MEGHQHGHNRPCRVQSGYFERGISKRTPIPHEGQHRVLGRRKSKGLEVWLEEQQLRIADNQRNWE